MKRNIAARDLHHMDEAMNLYNVFSKETVTSLKTLPTVTVPPKPMLSQFYQPSEEMRKYEYLWIILGTGAVGFIAYKYA